MDEKILLVDDESHVLRAYERQLYKHFSVATALGPFEGLQMVTDAAAEGKKFAVIVSDMRMPGMDGVQFLSKVQELSPESVRIMLTGNADVHTAIHAVNEGSIFRFLTKPCPRDVLSNALLAGLEQFRLVFAEKELLSKTLSGSVKVLTDVLSLVHPAAFGRAIRIRPLVRDLAAMVAAEKPWECELAAMLCPIGCVMLPEETLNRASAGGMLALSDHVSYQKHPLIGRNLVANIARLEGVAEIILYQDKHFDGSGFPENSTSEMQIPLGARILKVAIGYDRLMIPGAARRKVVAEMLATSGIYDPDILAALERWVIAEPAHRTIVIPVMNLREGMILAEHIESNLGNILVSKGHVVTESVRSRLVNYARIATIREPIHVILPNGDDAANRKTTPSHLELIGI